MQQAVLQVFFMHRRAQRKEVSRADGRAVRRSGEKKSRTGSETGAPEGKDIPGHFREEYKGDKKWYHLLERGRVIRNC